MITKRTALLGLLIVVLCTQATAAADITVLSVGAIETGLTDAAAAFQKQTRHVVKISFNTTPQIRTRVGAGEAWDVVIVTPAVIDEFAKAGKVDKDRVAVGRVGMGVTVRVGAPVPDISNVEALKRSVMGAESLIFNRASSGLYFEGLLKKMGVYEQVAGRITRYDDGAAVMEHVLKGRGREVGFGAMTEIVRFRDQGLLLVGPLPADVQNYTPYTAAAMTDTSDAEVARAFVRYLASPAAKTLLTAAGIEQ